MSITQPLPAHTTVVEVVRTYGLDGTFAPDGTPNETAPANDNAGRFDGWLRTRFNAALMAFEQAGLPLETAQYVARAILIHWWREIGPGRANAEFNFNVGNIKCMGTPSPDGPWTGYCHVLSDGLAYRAYPTLADGVADYVKLLRGTVHADGTRTGLYVPAMRYLIQNPRDGVGWYRRLVAAGYSEGSVESAAADFVSIDNALYNHFSKAS